MNVKKIAVTLLVIAAGLLACWAGRAGPAPDARDVSFGNLNLTRGSGETIADPFGQPGPDCAPVLPAVFDSALAAGTATFNDWDPPAGAYWHALSAGL